MWKLSPYLILFGTIALGTFAIREFLRGEYLWCVLGAVATIGLAITLFAPIPTQAVVQDLVDDG